jgi:type II restriction enzyme
MTKRKPISLLFCASAESQRTTRGIPIIASPRTAIADGAYEELDGMTRLRTFITELAGHIAAEPARS